MYHTLIFQPLYNGLVGVMDLLPWADLGIAVIIFTIIVKLVLAHLSKSSIITQIKMKEVEGDVASIKSQFVNDRQTLALKTMALYKEKGIKPFSGILLMIIQLPILLALISVFYHIIPEINQEFLYSFIDVPVVKTVFLGLIDLTKPSIILAILTAIAQFVQLQFSLAANPIKKSNETTKNLQPDMATMMHKQMKYTLPILAFASIYWIIPIKFPQAASTIAIYWIISALFTLGQELVIRRQYTKKNLVRP